MKSLYKKTYLSCIVLGIVGIILVYKGLLGDESIIVVVLGMVLLLLGGARYFILKNLLKEAEDMSVEEIGAYEQGLGSSDDTMKDE